MHKKIAAMVFAALVVLMSASGAAVASPEPIAPLACASSGTLNPAKTQYKLTAVSCTDGTRIRPWIDYRPSTGGPVSRGYGVCVSSGTSTATRPELGFVYVDHGRAFC